MDNDMRVVRYNNPMQQLDEWLLTGPGWMKFQILNDPNGITGSEVNVREARMALQADPQVQGLLKELKTWPGIPITNHKSAGLLLHKLVFLADIGLKITDPQVSEITAMILQHKSAEGPFRVLLNIPRHFGGSGREGFAWILCDSPLILYALARMGLDADPKIVQAAEYLAGLVRSNGWPCAASTEAGSFRGPGRKADPCPYANLIVLKALAQITDLRDSQAVRIGAETTLDLWQRRRSQHPYLFYMGNDFCKLKAPFIWYDILNTADVLSQLHWLREDPRLREMVSIITKKADANGRYVPESVWTSWKEWEFGQKKESSRWLTFLVERIKRRVSYD
jgi:hypothetical protein